MTDMQVDSITAEVVSRHLLAIAEEMAATLIRTAFSPNIKERADCSTAVFDARGRVIAQAQRVPIHLGSMIGAVDAVSARFLGEEIAPGDMFLANDPYSGGGSHLPDINVIAPVFRGERIVGWVANIAHHADVGGMVPGSEAAVCRSIFQEGLRIPPVRIVRAGEVNRDVVDIILLNSRTPDERNGDLRAQFACNVTGIRGVETLFQRYGDLTEPAIEAYLDFTRRRFRSAIDRIAAGTYRVEDFLDGDVRGETARIALTLTVGDGCMTLDFEGSAPQLGTARNIPRQAVIATVYTVAKSMLDPDVPANAGYFGAIAIRAPAGTVVQPAAPAPVGCRAISCGVLGDVIALALSQTMPGRAIAGSGPHHLAVFGGPESRGDGFFVNYETIAGGMGARPYRDGIDAVRVHASGAANLPVEALEHAYPLRVERYALRGGSGGAGERRGGDGVVRTYRALGDGITVSLSSERQLVPAPGLAGGAAGETGRFVVNPGTPNERVLGAAEADVALPRGTVISIETPGGGAYGPKERRSRQDTERDRREDRTRYVNAREAACESETAAHEQAAESRATESWFAARRGDYPATRGQAYFDVAARGLVSVGVRAALDGFLNQCMTEGGNKDWMFRIVEAARTSFAKFIGAHPDEVSLTKNVSEGINAVAAALPWRAGDNVVVCEALEHPANVFPWQHLARRAGVMVRTVAPRDGRVPADVMAEAIDGRTRLVTTSSVSFAPGYAFPVAEMAAECRRRGVLFLVDAAQSVGTLHVDVGALGVDALAASTQKGLLALYGLGFLYVRREVAESLTPVYLSRPGVLIAHGHEATAGDAAGYRLADGARRFDVGNFNYIGAVAVHQALQELAALGPHAIESRNRALAQRLAEGLVAAGLPVFGGADCPDRRHIVSIGTSLSDEHDTTGDALLRTLSQRFMAAGVRHTIRRGMLRLSVHLYNNSDDVDRACAVAQEFKATSHRPEGVSQMSPMERKESNRANLTNAKAVTIEINGQQEDMLRRLAASHPELGTTEDILRLGFAEFAKSKRLSHQ